jgi:hypothetical protein
MEEEDTITGWGMMTWTYYWLPGEHKYIFGKYTLFTTSILKIEPSQAIIRWLKSNGSKEM